MCIGGICNRKVKLAWSVKIKTHEVAFRCESRGIGLESSALLKKTKF